MCLIISVENGSDVRAKEDKQSGCYRTVYVSINFHGMIIDHGKSGQWLMI
jgi:hypothetical protein